MSRSFKRSIKKLIEIEGGFSNREDDTGGATKFGITEKVARENGYQGDMEDLPLDFAESVYLKEYWDSIGLTDIAVHSEDVAYKIFQTGVVCGIGTAVKFLQRALNALSKRYSEYDQLFEDLVIDGILGEKTLSAYQLLCNNYHEIGKESIFKLLNGQQTSYFLMLTEKDDIYKSSIYGWLNKRIK